VTPAGWLRDHVGDGTITILIGGVASFVRRCELVDAVAGRLRHGATVRDVHGVYRGLVRPSTDGSRYWVDLGPQWAFCWSCDMDALLAGEMVTAELQPVYGMHADEDESPAPVCNPITAPVLSAGKLHA